jgi:thiamine-monophosphate kinase
MALAESFDVHSMIDVSDGLVRDLRHLCRESGLGAELVAADIPVDEDAEGLPAALNDGEDYELLFTVPMKQAKSLAANSPISIPVKCIGRMTKGDELVLIHADGGRETLEFGGWEHQT